MLSFGFLLELSQFKPPMSTCVKLKFLSCQNVKMSLISNNKATYQQNRPRLAARNNRDQIEISKCFACFLRKGTHLWFRVSDSDICLPSAVLPPSYQTLWVIIMSHRDTCYICLSLLIIPLCPEGDFCPEDFISVPLRMDRVAPGFFTVVFVHCIPGALVTLTCYATNKFLPCLPSLSQQALQWQQRQSVCWRCVWACHHKEEKGPRQQ